MSTILLNLLAVLAILGVASAAPAAVLFSETFSYPDGHLASAPPDGGVSGGLWTVIPESKPNTHRANVSNGKIALLQLPPFPVISPPSGEDVQRGFSVLAAGQAIYAGFDVSVSGNDNHVDFARFLWSDPGPIYQSGTTLLINPFSGSDFTFRITYGQFGGVRWPDGLAFDTTYRVVMSYEFDTGSSKLWVNPASDSSTNVSLTVESHQSQDVSGFALYQRSLSDPTYNIPPSVQVLDNLVVGTTFGDVLAIPGPKLLGDYNSDGVVNAADYVVWCNGRGTIYTQNDYDVWRSHFGQTAGSGSALPSAESLSAAVPEPTTSILMILAAAGWSLRNRRAA